MKRRFGSPRYRGKRNGLNRRTRKMIVEGAKLGLPMKSCAALIGATDTVVRNWLDYGKDKRNTKYAFFRKQYYKARVYREIKALEAVHLAGTGGYEKTDTIIKTGPKGTETITKTTKQFPQWQAEAWFLERRRKLSYGREEVSTGRSPEEYAMAIIEAQRQISASVPTVGPDEE